MESDFEGITTQDIVLSSVAVAMSAVKKEGGDTNQLAEKLKGAITYTEDADGSGSVSFTGDGFTDASSKEAFTPIAISSD